MGTGAGQHMYHHNVVPQGIPGPGPMMHMASGNPGHPMNTLHTPVGTTSLSGTPMEVAPSDSMHQISEDIAMPAPVETMEELRAKYKQEIMRLEVSYLRHSLVTKISRIEIIPDCKGFTVHTLHTSCLLLVLGDTS